MHDGFAFPSTSDPLGLVAALIRRLGELHEVEVQGYDADIEGTVTVDLRLRLAERSVAPAKEVS